MRHTHRVTVPGTGFVALVNAETFDLPKLLLDLARIGKRRPLPVVEIL